ncbi:MAG: hypothetical protein ACTHOJ_17205 [Sphingomonas oligoaromativorans]
MASRGAKPDNVVAIGAALDQPVDAPLLGAPDPFAPDDGSDDDDGAARPVLPKGSPVRALGMKQQTCYYLDVKGQLIALGPRDHGKNNILALFSPRTNLPTVYWPRWSAPKTNPKTGEVTKPSEIIGFAQDDASEALIGACGDAGLFDPLGRVRGRGAHQGRQRALVVHCGDKVLFNGRKIDGSPRDPVWHDPDVIEGMVYPAFAPSPRPHPDPVSVEIGEHLLATFCTWRWKRPILDPMLLLGWAGQSFICGALDWRTHVFITGGAGTGKSTLNGKNALFDRLLGKGLLRTGSATEAAVRQLLGAQTIPVIFDEFEPSEFNAHKTKAMLELARVASSGDDMHKGGMDHQAQQFVLQSAFQFSAILMPVMQPQDRSRFAVLELKPFPKRAAALDAEDDDVPASGIDLEALRLPEVGRKLQRRMIDGWPRFHETLRLYRRALERVGHSPRGQDTFGTLLACADLLLYDHLPDRELVDEWAQACAPDGLAEITNMVAEHDSCLNHLATSMVQARGGDERSTIASWVEKAMADARAMDMGDPQAGTTWARNLEHLGLRLVSLRQTAKGWGTKAWRPGEDAFLAVAGDHVGLSALFRDTRWQNGAWSQALGRVEVERLAGGETVTDRAVTSVYVKFDGRGMRATCVPLAAVLDLEEGQS